MSQSHQQAWRVGWPIAESLGWLSVGLGVAALLAPRRMGQLSGLDDKQGLIQLVGARELASGVGLLSEPNKSPWLWARVVGDAIDLAVLATAHGQTQRGRSRALGTAAVVAAITAADVAASLRQSKFRRDDVAPDGVCIDRNIVVNKTPQECYAYWRDLRNIAYFTRGLREVTPLDERRSRWIAKVPGRADLEWIVELTEDRPVERLRWRSAEGGPFKHAGSVSFRVAPGNRGTIVTLSMHYHIPGGSVGATVARFIGPDPFGEVRENLRRFKQLIETGEIPTTTGQPSGRRSLLGLLFPEGRRSRQRQTRGLQTLAGRSEAGPRGSCPAASLGATSDASTLREERIS
jgi:uncharacterized membrane protein